MVGSADAGFLVHSHARRHKQLAILGDIDLKEAFYNGAAGSLIAVQFVGRSSVPL